MLARHSTGGFAATSAPDGFGIEDFEEAGLRVVERRFGPKDIIFTPGDPDDQLYFVLFGTVRLYKIYGDYKEATTALLKDGGVFAEAVTEARVAGIQKTSLERVVKRDPEFALRLFSSLSERLRQSDEVIESLLHREVSTREAVSKVMSEFQRDGLIETRSRRIAILDPDALARQAAGPSGLSVDGQLSI